VEGVGRPLVLLGGGTYGARALAPHARELAGEFQAVRLQTLNVDRSSPPAPLPAEYSVRLESAAMTNALDRLGLSAPLDVVGWSYGSLVALDFALNQPGRIRTLTLFEPPALWVVSLGERSAAADMRIVDELGSRLGPDSTPTDDEYRRFLEAVGNPPARLPLPEDVDYEGWAVRRAALRCLGAVSRHRDAVERLKAFRRPVLIMVGTDTVAFHRRISDLLAEALPLVERFELPGGHMAPITARGEFLDAVRRFVGNPDDPVTRSSV
jgi:pimeloyl-ACP methyl ester carboxylesterase